MARDQAAFEKKVEDIKASNYKNELEDVNFLKGKLAALEANGMKASKVLKLRKIVIIFLQHAVEREQEKTKLGMKLIEDNLAIVLTKMKAIDGTEPHA